MLKNILFYVITVLIVVEIMFTSYMAYNSLQNQDVCAIGKSCEQVQQTKYGQIFGIKLAVIAVFAFIFLLIFYFYNYRIFLFGSIIGFIISIYLIGIQAVVLKMYCINCLFVDIIMILIFFLSIIEFYFRRRKALKTTNFSIK